MKTTSNQAPDLNRISKLVQEITITASCTASVAEGWDSDPVHVLMCQIQRMGAAADAIRKELGDLPLVGDANAWLLGDQA